MPRLREIVRLQENVRDLLQSRATVFRAVRATLTLVVNQAFGLLVTDYDNRIEEASLNQNHMVFFKWLSSRLDSMESKFESK